MKKKTFILLIVLMPFISKGQIFSDMGAGYDLYGSPIGTWAVGYDKGLLNLEAEIRPSLTRRSERNNYMGFRLSANVINPDDSFLSILPGIGYYYNLRSQDKVKLNNWYFGTAIKTAIQITENGGLFIEALFINQSAQFNLGIHFTFTKQERLYYDQ